MNNRVEQLERTAKAVAAGGAVVAAATYGLGYTAAAEYYGAFGLTPADAGVSQTELVARAVSALVGYLALAGYVVLVAGWQRRILDRVTSGRPWLRRHRSVLTVPATVATVVLFVVCMATGHFVLALLLLATIAGLPIASAALDPRPLRLPSWLPAPPYPVALATATVAAAVCLAVSVSAASLADAVLSGRRSPASATEDALRRAVGLSAVLLADRCAWVIARTGDRAWVLEHGPNGPAVAPEAVDDLSFVPGRSSC